MKHVTFPLLVLRRLLPLLLIFCLALPALAHRVRVFAYVSGNEIFSEASLGNNQPVVHGEVIVTRGSIGEVLVQGKTDKQGRFSFSKPDLLPGESLVITVNTGQGHQGSWTLTPADFGHHPSPKANKKLQAQINEIHPTPLSLSPEEQQHLADLVAGAVAREVEPLKRMLAQQMNNEPSLQDIIGGIGWLVGIGGLLFALKKKHLN